MSSAATITTEVDVETLRLLADMAVDRGTTAKALAGELIEQAVAEEARLRAKIEEGRRQIAAGEYVTHEDLVEQIRLWKQEQRRAA